MAVYKPEARYEAGARIELTAWTRESELTGEPLKRAQEARAAMIAVMGLSPEALESALATLASAISDIPTAKRQPTTADPYVIGLIDQALKYGWGLRYYPVRDAGWTFPRHLIPKPKMPEIPKYEFEPSLGKKFRRLAQIVLRCALGRKSITPIRR
ncbi:MAG: hypothetical protein CGW95_15495 [Phenylobacterium zucineum]|nr:MAG: hypothetical protein CGW95_15495 [Phenylobacterium zucineum]